MLRRGKGEYRARLDGPPFPEGLEYLHRWHVELLGRSGAGMDGLNPLTYETLAAWAALLRRQPEPHEVQALLTLDVVARHPEEVLKDDGW